MLFGKQYNLNDSRYAAIIILFYIACSLIYSPICEILGYDKEVFRYMGMLIANGGIPYTEAFDHKPPIIYLFNFLGFLFTPKSTWGVFLLINFLGVFSAILVYQVSKKITGFVNFSLVIALLYVSLINYPPLLNGGNLTRQLSVYFIIYLYGFIFLTGSRILKMLGIGMMFSLVFFTQQNEIIATIPIIIFTLFNHSNSKKLLIEIFYLIMGFSIPAACVTFLLFYWGNFDDFVAQAFVYNIQDYSLPYVPLLHRLLRVPHLTLSTIPLIFLILVSLMYMLFKIKETKRIQIVLLVAILLQTYSTAMRGGILSHYYLMFLPYIILLLTYTFGDLYERYQPKFRLVFWLYVLVVLSLNFKKIYFSKPYDAENPIALEVAKMENRKGQFYSFEAPYLRLNADFNIQSPTKWIYTDFPSSRVDSKGEIINQIIKDLKDNRTTYVLINENRKKPDNKIEHFLQLHYNPVIRDRVLTLHIRKM